MHALAVPGVGLKGATEFGATAARKTVLDASWAPRGDVLLSYLRWQPLLWSLIGIGIVLAAARRQFRVLSLSLVLAPILVYRNAFPYYYVVMLAPASVLSAFAVREIEALVRTYAGRAFSTAALLLIVLGVIYQGGHFAWRLGLDEQQHQRQLVAAVHQVFREPVNYIDRCGMISSFRKVNFFMSTWGMDGYRERNQPFMPAAIRDSRPAFVLVNSGNLNPDRPSSGGLLEEDYVLIDRFYPKYWGPLRVAGASAKLSGSLPTKLQVPFPGQYRLDADGPVVVDGVPRRKGDVINVPADGVSVQATAPDEPERETVVKLFLATAEPPPADQLPGVPLFSGL